MVPIMYLLKSEIVTIHLGSSKLVRRSLAIIDCILIEMVYKIQKRNLSNLLSINDLWNYLTHLVVLATFAKGKWKKEMGCTAIPAIRLSILIA
jgi:hypothetical protein